MAGISKEATNNIVDIHSSMAKTKRHMKNIDASNVGPPSTPIPLPRFILANVKCTDHDMSHKCTMSLIKRDHIMLVDHIRTCISIPCSGSA